MTEEKVHYAIHVRVERITKNMDVEKEYDSASRTNVAKLTETSRDVVEVATLVFTAADTKDMSKKISAHIALITDGEIG